MCRQTDRQTQAGRHRQAEAGRQNTHTHTHTHTRRTHPSKQIHTQTHTDTHMHRSASLRAPLHCRYQHEPRVIEEANICVKWIIRCLGRYSIDLGQSASREPLSLAHSGAGKTKAGGGGGGRERECPVLAAKTPCLSSSSLRLFLVFLILLCFVCLCNVTTAAFITPLATSTRSLLLSNS